MFGIGLDELLLIAIILGFMGSWIWLLVDCATKETDEGSQRLIWLLVIALAGWIGGLVYLLARRPRRKKLLGR